MSSMGHFSDKLRDAFKTCDVSSFHTAMDLGIDPAVMSKVLSGKRKPPKGFVEKLATVEKLTLTVDQLMAWKLRDEYTPYQIQLAAALSD